MSKISEQLRREVEAWIADDPDPQTAATLQRYLDTDDSDELARAFNGFLEFGTAGLRGRIGPGPSQMNRALVTRAAAGLARYMSSHSLKSLVIGRDARYGSEDFAQDTAEIFSGAGFDVYLLPRPLPTPVLAFAINALGVDGGVMVTASHNPPQDNGYKVYLGGVVDGIVYRGSQIISPADSEIFAEIKAITKISELARAKSWTLLDQSIVDRYIDATSSILNSLRANKAPKKSDLKIVYTAMHGVGTETLLTLFKKSAIPLPSLVESQADPDPDFPTVAFPNPEEPGAMDLALEKAREISADLVIANDPDADRCAIAILDHGDWRTLRGDEVGAILGKFIAANLDDAERASAVFANSIVSSSLLSEIAKKYKIAFRQTLTGFKWLAKVEGLTFGYEEALGYAVDPSVVNDKDGLSAALLIAELAWQLKETGSDLSQYLDEIWREYGYFATSQLSIRLNDLSLTSKALTALQSLREIGEYAILSIEDLSAGSEDLPPTDGVRIWLNNHECGGKIRLIVRPSGTEPKLKCYLEVVGPREIADEIIVKLKSSLNEIIDRALS
jgi:phosphomannomutase